MVLTKSISRFARNTLDCLKYIRMLKEKGIAVYFQKENINTLDAKGEVMITIMASLAQQESESISKNVKLGIDFRNKQGKVQVNPSGKKRMYSCTHCFSQMVVCGSCGEVFRRIHWNNHGCRSIVWRCASRLE